MKKWIVITWIVCLFLIVLTLSLTAYSNLQKGERPNVQEKANEVKHYEESRDQLSNVNVTDPQLSKLVETMISLMPIIIAVTILCSVIGMFLKK